MAKFPLNFPAIYGPKLLEYGVFTVPSIINIPNIVGDSVIIDYLWHRLWGIKGVQKYPVFLTLFRFAQPGLCRQKHCEGNNVGGKFTGGTCLAKCLLCWQGRSCGFLVNVLCNFDTNNK